VRKQPKKPACRNVLKNGGMGIRVTSLVAVMGIRGLMKWIAMPYDDVRQHCLRDGRSLTPSTAVVNAVIRSSQAEPRWSMAY